MRVVPTGCPDMYSPCVDKPVGKGNLGRNILRMAEALRGMFAGGLAKRLNR